MPQMLRSEMARSYGDGSIEERLGAAAEIATSTRPAARVQLCLMQLLLPDLVSTIEKVIVDAADDPRVRRLAGGLLTYVYNPLDLIGDDSPLGRVDDAIVCARGLLRLADGFDVELSPDARAICEAAADALPLLNRSLRDAIVSFGEDLERSASAGDTDVLRRRVER